METARLDKKSLNAAESAEPGFVRDRLAYFCYIMIATYSFASATLGPLMVYLRSELLLDYATTAWHFSIWSFGAFLAGFTGDKCVSRFGKRNTVWTWCLVLFAGLSLIISVHSPVGTLIGCFLCGLAGSTMNQTLFSVIADKFQEFRTIAIAEINIMTSTLSCLAPIVVGKLSETALQWRSALILPMICFALYFILGRNLLESSNEQASSSRVVAGGNLPLSFWTHWLLILLSVSAEWTIIFWAAEFFQSVLKLSKADAASSVTLFFAAMVTGRIIGRRLAGSFKPKQILKGASFVAMLGFSIFWLCPNVQLCLLGFFICGTGISNFYPMTYSLAVACAEGQTSKATSKISLATGASVLVTPLLLGFIAQRSGIFLAYGVIAILLAICSAMVCLPIWGKTNKTEASH